jgi:hypothetical protein
LKDFLDPLRREVRAVHLEIHPGVVRLHIAPGHQRFVVPEDNAAEDVQGGVHAHQRVSAIPVDRSAHRCAGFGERGGRIGQVDNARVGASAAENRHC